ncbi:MAG TPA: hypothetical protein VKB26_13435 [Candidatus Acidoferrales bacterium]|nr:hypothetical protein [Candidatus Acidoferrales bacterium]
MASANPVSPVLDAERRSWDYWFVDGLPYLSAGILGLLIAAIFLLVDRYGHTHSPFLIVLVVVMLGFVALVYARLRQTLEWLKSRITYPRTGYVPPPYFTDHSTPPADLVMLNLSGVREKETIAPLLVSEDLRWRLWVALLILPAEPLVGQFIASHALCTLIGCVGGFFAWLLSRKDPRKAWAVLFGLLFAQIYTCDFLSRPHIEGAFYFLAGVGFALALAGAIVLARYLRRNPVARA